ncbi:MAG: GGDEF domain-containing protein [Telluria sp.]
MRKDAVQTRQLDAPQLRVLLTLSRELFQTDEADSALQLVGRSLVEIIHPDSTLLLLRGYRLDVVGFDSRGITEPASTDHPLYGTGMATLSNTGCASGGFMETNRQCEQVGPRTLALAVPAYAAVAILVARWDHDLDPAELGRYKRTMLAILELAAAALGKIEARSSLERLVWNQREQMAATSVTHAAELARRDEVATEMRMLSLIDVLTGLYNRRGFFVQAEHLFKVSHRKRARSAVIFADIDGLKGINDEFGHDNGDSVIRDAGAVFRQSFRQADVVARLGGDEFVAYTLDDEHPEVILARIQENLHAFNPMQEPSYALSISAGVVQCDPDGEQTLSDYLRLADEKMYVQKRSRLH